MRATIRRIVHADSDFTGEEVLYPQVPLINVCVACLFRAQVIFIVVSPHRQLAIFLALRCRDPRRKWIFERGILRHVIVLS